MKTRFLSLLLVASLFISTSIIAQPAKDGKQGNRNPEHFAMMQMHQDQRKGEFQKFFTEEQQETMKKLRIETAKKVKPLKDQLRELNAHQQTLTTAEKADLTAINKNIDKMSEAKTEIAKIMAAQHQQVRAMLTEEQLLKFDTMKSKGAPEKGREYQRNNKYQKNQMHSRRGV